MERSRNSLKEFTQLLEQAKRDKRALRDLLKRSEAASKKIEDLTDPAEAIAATATSLRSQMSELEAHATTLKDSVSRLESLEQREEAIAKSQKSLTEAVERGSSGASRVEDRINKIHAQMETVSSSEKMIANLLDPNGGLTKVRSRIDELMADVDRLEARGTDLAQIEARMGAIGKQAGDLEEDQKAMARSIESVSKRLVEADERVAELGDGMKSIAQLRREIEEISGPNGALAGMRAQLEQAHEETLGYGEEVTRLSDDQVVVRAAQDRVMARYEELRAKVEAADAGVDRGERQCGSCRQGDGGPQQSRGARGADGTAAERPEDFVRPHQRQDRIGRAAT